MQSVGVAEMEMRYCVRVGGWDRRVFDAGGGIERSGVMVMKWSIIIIIPLHITSRVGCPRVLAHVGIIIFL